MSTLINSKHQKLTQDEIIAIAAREAGNGETMEQVKASLAVEAYKMHALMMREGNTIFVVHQAPNEPTLGILRTINADTVPNYCKNCVVFAKAVGLAGFKKFVTAFPERDKSLLAVVKYVVDKHPPFHNMKYKVIRGESGTYVVTVDLGKVTHGGLSHMGNK